MFCNLFTQPSSCRPLKLGFYATFPPVVPETGIYNTRAVLVGGGRIHTWTGRVARAHRPGRHTLVISLILLVVRL